MTFDGALSRSPRPTTYLTTASLALHLPFLWWLAAGHSAAPFGDLRSFAAFFGLALLWWLRRAKSRHRGSPPAAAIVALSLAGALALLGLFVPMVWALSLGLLAAGLIMASTPGPSPWSTLPNHAVLVLLAVTAFPYERELSPLVDPFLQTFTAWCAAPLVRATGLAVEATAGITHGVDPMLVGDRLFVTVNSLCAGSQTLLSLWTLGLIIAEVFLARWDVRLVFVALTPLFGFMGNILRVAVSTHAADRWGDTGITWDIAHDVIGYGAFAATYVLLIVTVRLLRRVRAPGTPKKPA